MKKKLNSYFIEAELDPSTGLDSEQPDSGGSFRARSIAALEELKQRLLQEYARFKFDSAALSSLRLAAEEAASLAWTTPFPLLVLPELFAEKAEEASNRSQRQQEIRRRSLGLSSLDS